MLAEATDALSSAARPAAAAAVSEELGFGGAFGGGACKTYYADYFPLFFTNAFRLQRVAVKYTFYVTQYCLHNVTWIIL